MKKLFLFISSLIISIASFAQAQHTKTADIISFPEIKERFYTVGLQSSSNVTNYTAASVDSAYHRAQTVAYGTSTTQYGGWLTAHASGDSIQIILPFGVVFGDSQAEGHTSLHGRLHPNGVAGFTPAYPDSFGQITYALDSITHFPWYNHGIGGQTIAQCVWRFERDVMAGFGATDVGGSRGNQTLTRRPRIVVIIAGINDVAAGTSADIIERNMEYIAKRCSDYNIRCVFFNLPGDGTSSLAMMQEVNTINRWMNSGSLQNWGAAVYDYASFWSTAANNGNYAQFQVDNTHPGPTAIDDIHQTKIGYNNVAIDLVKKMNIPILDSVIICQEMAPSNALTNYARATSITINGVSFSPSGTKGTDTLAVSTFLGNRGSLKDSVWVKIVSSTTIAGAGTQSGFANIIFLLDNNPFNQVRYTQRLPIGGGSQSTNYLAQLTIIAPTTGNYNPVTQYFNDGSNIGFVIKQLDENHTEVWINPLTSTSAISPNAVLQAFGDVATSGSVVASSGTQSRFGAMQIGMGSDAPITGWGLGAYAGSLGTTVYFISSGASATQGFVMKRAATPNLTNNTITGNVVSLVTYGNGVASANNSADYWAHPTVNITAVTGLTGAKVYTGGFIYDPVLTSLSTEVYPYGFWSIHGDNYFSQLDGQTSVGTSVPYPSAKFDVNVQSQVYAGVEVPHLTSAQRDSIGYISSVTTSAGGSYTVAPTPSFSGGTGSGATLTTSISGSSLTVQVNKKGYGWKTSSVPTVVLTGGSGSGWTGTVNVHGPDSGLVIFNITIDSLQMYTGTAWISLSGFQNPMTTTGDIIYQAAAGPTRLPIGSTNNALIVTGGVPAWGPVLTSASNFTSTWTNTTNLSSSTFNSCYYIQVGNLVQVTMSGTVSPTSGATNTVLTVTLPINATTTTQTGIGVATIADNGVGNATIAGIVSIASASTATMTFKSITAASSPVAITFQYKIN